MSTYIHFTEEQKQRAAAVDLEEFLRFRGEKLIPSGREKRLAKDHSVTVRGNEWYDHAEEKGGHAVSFVQRFYNLSYPEAMTMLLGGEVGTIYPSATERVEEPPKPFVLPPIHSDMRRVYAYLVKHRNIDRSVVAHFAREKLLYEDAKYHNAVFVGTDEEVSHATPTSGVLTATAKPSGSMWRAAIPATAFTIWAQTKVSLYSRRPSICSPTSHSIRRTGSATAM